MIGILDYGVGNLGSIQNMLRKIGVMAVMAADAETVSRCTKLILPGVGHFDYCMQQLRAAPFYNLMQQKVLEEKMPVLGVCAGCQMLFEKSEEGTETGLGWLQGSVIRFRAEKMPAALKIPHMGWTDLEVTDTSGLYQGFEETPRFYFVHSYHVSCPAEMVTARANYGYPFPASVKNGNIIGVQFHPEKSHAFGIRLYENFAKRAL